MSIPVRARDQEYFPNGETQTLKVKFTKEKGSYLDWDIVVHWYDTEAHDLQKRIAERTDCATFMDFMFLFKRSFACLVRSLRSVPQRQTSFMVVFRNRNLRYIVTFLEEVDGVYRFAFKTVLDSSWRIKGDAQVFSISL